MERVKNYRKVVKGYKETITVFRDTTVHDYMINNGYDSKETVEMYIEYLYLYGSISEYKSVFDEVITTYSDICTTLDNCNFSYLGYKVIDMPSTDVVLSRKDKERYVYSERGAKEFKWYIEEMKKLKKLNPFDFEVMNEDNFWISYFVFMTNLYGWEGDMEKSDMYMNYLNQWISRFGNL